MSPDPPPPQLLFATTLFISVFVRFAGVEAVAKSGFVLKTGAGPKAGQSFLSAPFPRPKQDGIKLTQFMMVLGVFSANQSTQLKCSIKQWIFGKVSSKIRN